MSTLKGPFKRLIILTAAHMTLKGPYYKGWVTQVLSFFERSLYLLPGTSMWSLHALKKVHRAHLQANIPN